MDERDGERNSDEVVAEFDQTNGKAPGLEGDDALPDEERPDGGMADEGLDESLSTGLVEGFFTEPEDDERHD